MELIGQGGDGVDWINMAGDRDKWQNLSNIVLKLVFHTRQGIC